MDTQTKISIGIAGFLLLIFLIAAPILYTTFTSQTKNEIPSQADVPQSLKEPPAPTTTPSFTSKKLGSFLEQSTSTTSTQSAQATTSPKTSLFIKKSPKPSATSTPSTEVKIVKPKPIHVPLAPKASAKNIVPDQYIVVLKTTTSTNPLPGIIKKYGITTQFQYKKIFQGFSATLDAKKIDALKKDPLVEFVAQNYIVSISATTTTTTTTPTPSSLPPSISAPPPDPKKTQVIPTGYSRILAHSATIQGTGVGIAVLDTGIDLMHPDLKQRIMAHTSCISSAKTGNDDNGHGSHVAGIIGGIDNSFGVIGVAPQANLLAVKVLDAQGMGTWSSVLCGIEWIQQNKEKYGIKVALMGFTGKGINDAACGKTNKDPLHYAICQSAQNGITHIAAAGNDGADISAYVPAAYTDTLITVSAFVDTDGATREKGVPTILGDDDTFASFSNFGPTIAFGAPGVNILSTGKNGMYYVASGTSMAAAYAAGTAAIYIQSHPGVSWRDVKTALQLGGEHQGADHSDVSGLHPEVLLQVVVF
jgi:subtilisin family serine protease